MRSLAVALLVAWLAGCGGKPKPAPPPRRPVSVAPLPAKAYAHYLRGRLAAIAGDYKRAARELAKAARAAPGEAPIRVALIEALYRSGDRQRALAISKRARKRFPHHSDVWLVSGRILGSLNRWKRAVSMFERAVDLDPKNLTAYMALAAAWVALGELGKGEAVYRRLLELNKGYAPANYRLSELHLARRSYEKVLVHIRRVLEVNPDHLRAKVVLSRALRGLGRNKASIAVLRAAFDRSGGDPDVAGRLFRQLLDADERAFAIALIGRLDRDDLVLPTRISLGYLYLQIHARKQALRHVNHLLRRYPDSSRAKLLKGQTLAELRRRKQAIPVLLSVPSTAPVYVACRALAAELLAKTGRATEAIAALAAARAAYPNNLDLTAALAQVHELRGAASEARAMFEQAIAKHPRNIDLLYAAGAFEDRAGRWKRAAAYMERVLRIDPENAEAMNFLGYLLADRGEQLDRAEQLIRQAISRSTISGYMLDSLGWVLFRRGKTAQAERALERARRLIPGEPEVYYHLAEVYAAKRQRSRALKLLERARTLHPERRLAARIQARIQALRGNK